MNDEELKEKLNQPKKVEIDGQKFEGHSLSDVADFDRYLSSKKAVKHRNSGLKFTKLEPPGAC